MVMNYVYRRMPNGMLLAVDQFSAGKKQEESV
jgi:hypothetical protein